MARKFTQRFRAWVRSYFGFSRTETNGFLILLPLTAIILFSEPVYRRWLTNRPLDFSKDARALDSITATLDWTKSTSLQDSTAPGVQFFRFDPNTASRDDLSKLGLSSTLASRLLRYREKGGRFRKKEDLLKIYGFDSTWFMQARDWIRIPETYRGQKGGMHHEQIPVKTEKTDINVADSIQLLKVYGIGPALSRRIRTFRDRLGGFVSMDQLKEVYGLDSAVVQKLQAKFFVEKHFQPKRINLNTVTLEAFRHPYVKWKEAQAILAYRLQHGAFQSLDQLHDIAALPPGWLEKIKPYLTLE